MARVARKNVPSRKAAKPVAKTSPPQISAAVRPEFKAAVEAYCARNKLTLSSLVIQSITEKIGGRIKDSVSRRRARSV